jgi:hypothetical protein
LRGTLNASDIVTGTIDAARINTDSLFTESVTVTNTISIGTETDAMVIGPDQSYAGGGELGDGIKLNDNNYWFYSTSEGFPVFKIGDSANYVEWDGSELTVRGTLNASDIKTGTIDVARLNVDEILSENATVNGTLNIGTLGEITFDGGLLDENGLTLDLASYASTGSAIKWGTDTAYIYTEVIGAVPFLKSETSGVIELIAGSEKVSVDSTLSLVTVDSDLTVTGNSIIDSILIKLDNIPLSSPATPNCVWVDANGFLRLS